MRNAYRHGTSVLFSAADLPPSPQCPPTPEPACVRTSESIGTEHQRRAAHKQSNEVTASLDQHRIWEIS